MPTLDPVYWISTPIFPSWGTKNKFIIPMIKYNSGRTLDWNYTRFLPDNVNYTNEKYYTPARMDNPKVNCSSDISHSLSSVPYNKWWLYPWDSSHDADNYLVGGQDVQSGWDFWFQTSCSELPPESWSADPIENIDYSENGFNKWETHWYRMSIKLGNGTFVHTEFSNDGVYIQKYSLSGIPCHGAGSIDIGSTLQYYKPYQDGMFAIVGLYRDGFDPDNPDPDYIEDFAIITNVNHPSSYEWNYFRLYGWENFEFHHEDDPDEPPTEDDMEIKKPYLGSFFNRVYCCKRDHVTALATYVCQTIPQARISDWENFLTRLNMAWGGFGEWLDSVIDVTIFPFNLPNRGVDMTAVPNNTVRFSPADISMGTWTSANWDDVTFSATIYKINSTDCLFDATGWKLISRKFNDFRDFPPYRKSVLYIPFVGNVEFNLHNYYGKYMKIKYAVDLMNGGCRAFICVSPSNTTPSDDGIIVASYDGQMGVHVPVSKLEYGEYYSSITQALGNTISSAASTGANLAMGGTEIPTSITSKPIKNKILAKGAEKLNLIKGKINSSKLMNSNFGIQARRLGEGAKQGIVGGFEGSIAGVGSGSLEAFQSVFSLNRAESNVPFSTSGSCTPSLSAYTDWFCRIIWYESVTNESGNLLQMKGYPSNKSGALNSFSGYLSVSDVKLVCPKATENEKAMIREMLTNGIYI